MYFQRLKLCDAVIKSMAGQYLRAKWSISNVEFHHVETSQGIMQQGRLVEASVLNHCGRRMVVGFFKAYASLQSLKYSEFF